MNPRASCPTYTLSRGASSPLEYFSKVKMFFKYSLFGAVRFPSAPHRVWRREWDSNPRGLAPKRFSRPPRYDRFDISPYTLNRKCFLHCLFLRGSASLCPACGARKFTAFPIGKLVYFRPLCTATLASSATGGARFALRFDISPN